MTMSYHHRRTSGPKIGFLQRLAGNARFSSQNEQAQALRDDGRTVAQIAREMRMTEEQVRILLLDWENE
jgi:hypothetical protein